MESDVDRFTLTTVWRLYNFLCLRVQRIKIWIAICAEPDKSAYCWH
jgi:hypothetical protein